MRLGTLCYVRMNCDDQRYRGRICEVVSGPIRAVRRGDDAERVAYRCRFNDFATKLTDACLLTPITPPEKVAA